MVTIEVIYIPYPIQEVLIGASDLNKFVVNRSISDKYKIS